MTTELVELQPSELKFVIELKKQSTCSVQLVNKSAHYIAFKVKTTAPKKYCVRPNVGIVSPNSTCDFTVTMQAQKVTLPDLHCKDKFLVQSIVVPEGTTDEGLHSAMFSKESGRSMDEKKLRVVFIIPPNSPDVRPINGSPYKESPISAETLFSPQDAPLKSQTPPSIETVDLPLPFQSVEDFSKEKISPVKDRPVGPKVNKVLEVDDEMAASRVALLESKLKEAEQMITRLTEAHNLSFHEKSKLQQEIVLLRRRVAAEGRLGFPFLFVCFVALAALTIGYMVHA